MGKLNRDVVTRDKMIFGSYESSKYCGGIRRFKGLNLDTLKMLVQKNFAEEEEAQNYAPTTAEIIEFMSKHEGYTAHGYAVSIERGDYRVTLEGVSKDRAADSAEELEEFKTLFKEADTLNTNAKMYCWFD